MTEQVRIADIDDARSAAMNPRQSIDTEAVARYAQCLDDLPPVTLYRVGGTLLVADGLHRLAAAKSLGRDTLAAEVHDGSVRDLLEAVVRGNLQHGRAWTRAERRACVDVWLRLYPERADNWIGADLGVSKNTVGDRRLALEATCQIDTLDRLTGRDGKQRPRELESSPNGLPPFEWAPEGYRIPADMTEGEWESHDQAFRTLRDALVSAGYGGRAYMEDVDLRTDVNLTARTVLTPETVQRYADAMQAGAIFSPVVALPDGRIVDGNMRLYAARVGYNLQTIVVDLTEEQACRVSVHVNSRHGLPLTTRERNRAFERLATGDRSRDVAKWGRLVGVPPATGRAILAGDGTDEEGDDETPERLPIDRIIIGYRIRKDLGNLRQLADSIARLGLMHPVVVRPDHVLVDGARRLAACKMLGWSEVPVRVAVGLEDEGAVLNAQVSAQLWKDLLPSELVALGEAIEALEHEQEVNTDGDD